MKFGLRTPNPKSMLKEIGGPLSGECSYDMVDEWKLFVHRERAEIERRIASLSEDGGEERGAV